jgi:hypothetical protein
MGIILPTQAARPFHRDFILLVQFGYAAARRSILPWAFPPTLEQSEKFKSDISAKIDQMLKWLLPRLIARKRI